MLAGLERTQREVASLLDSLISSGEFPNAVLFSGDRFTGRMFASRQVCLALGIPDENVLIISDRNHAYRIRPQAAMREMRT